MVRYVGVENMVRLIGAIGVEPYLIGLAGYIEEDFRRWNAFEKAPRVASHSRNVGKQAVFSSAPPPWPWAASCSASHRLKL